MKLSNIKYLMIAMLVAFVSCNKVENMPAVSVKSDEGFVNIGSLSTIADDSYKEAGTKVKYGNLNSTTNKWELKWDAGDKVKITRHGGNPQSQDYIVTPATDNTKGTLQIDGNENDRLRWSTGGSSDIFSVVYPSDAVVGTPSNFEVELQYDMRTSIQAVKGAEALVDMTKFRMLNFQSVNRTNNSINLTSVPATTTLDITINGPNSGYLSVTRIAIVINNTNKYISKDGKVKFKYNTTTGNVDYVTYNDAPTEVTFVVTIANNGGYLDLNSGENIKFKAFIPGIPYNTGDYKVRVNYGTSGKLYTPTVDLRKNVKHPLSINASAGDDSGWIGDLPDDMKVINMSIPGSYYCNSYLYTTTGLQPKVQNINIIGQWNQGIRVFYTPCDYSGSTIVSAAQGFASVHKNKELITNELFDKLISMLQKQPREFAIVINTYSGGRSSRYYSTFKDTYDTFISGYKDNNPNYFYTGNFSNNIKIEDLRGKILVIHESNNSNIGPILNRWVELDSQGTSPFTNFTIGGQQSSVVSIDETLRTQFSSNDRHNLAKSNFGNAGIGTMWTITDFAVHEPNRNNGGYITGSINNMPTLIDAAKMFDRVGIVLFPFVGDRKLLGGNTGGEQRDVWGDVIHQVIINKNYK